MQNNKLIDERHTDFLSFPDFKITLRAEVTLLRGFTVN